MKKFTFETTEEMKSILLQKDYEVASTIVKVALDNLDLKEGEEVDVMEFYTEDSDLIYEVGIAQEDLLETLKVNLETMEYHEDYEMCQKIMNAINQLENND